MANITTILEETNKLLRAVEATSDTLSEKSITLFTELDDKISEAKLAIEDIINSNDLKNDVEELKTLIHDYIHRNDIEFMLIKNGKRIRYKSDTVDKKALDAGFDLFCPHNREEYELARLYLLSLGEAKSMGPLGVYKPTNRGNSVYKPFNSEGMGKDGWTVRDGWPTWWGSDLTNVSEPNGDYIANAYLGISYNNDGYIRWYNDANNVYSYTTYLCVKRK